jgi:hypothetical protein
MLQPTKVKLTLLIFCGIYGLLLFLAFYKLSDRLVPTYQERKSEFNTNPPNLRIGINLFYPLNAGSSPRITLSSIVYYLPKTSLEEPDQLCLDEITVLEHSSYFRSAEAAHHTAEIVPHCVNLIQIKPGQVKPESLLPFKTFYTIDDFQNEELELAGYANNALYPYDGFTSKISMEINYRLLEGDKLIDGGVTSPLLYVENPPLTLEVEDQPSVLEWDIKVTGREESGIEFIPWSKDFTGTSKVERFRVVQIVFSRPFIFRLIYPIIVASMLVLIGLLSNVQSLDAFMEGAVAVLLGIFGLKQVLLTPNLQVRTILDFAILGLYVAFAVALVTFLMTTYFHAPKKVELHKSHVKVQEKITSDSINDPNINISVSESSSPNSAQQFPAWLATIGMSIIVIWLVSRFRRRKN